MRLALIILLTALLSACSQPSIDDLDGGCSCFDSAAQEALVYTEADWLQEGYDKQLSAAHDALWRDKPLHWSTEHNGLRLGIALSHTEMHDDEKLRIRIVVENCSSEEIELEYPEWNSMIVPLGSPSRNSGQVYSRASGQIEAVEMICECISQQAVIITAGESHEFFVKSCVHSGPQLSGLQEFLNDDIYYEGLYWAGSASETNEEICVRLDYNAENSDATNSWQGKLESPVVPLTIIRKPTSADKTHHP